MTILQTRRRFLTTISMAGAAGLVGVPQVRGAEAEAATVDGAFGGDEGRVDAFGRGALARAAQSGKPEAVELLIRRGAAVDAADDHGMTALMLAARAGSLGAVDALEEALVSFVRPGMRSRCEEVSAESRAALGANAFDAAYARGRAMNCEQSIAFAEAGFATPR